MPERTGEPTHRFPPDFLWGAATASHQVEGGNRWNDWWAFEQGQRLPEASGDACRHFELYEQDFGLARSLGHTAHRFSIEWSRIEQEPGRFDPAATEHYGAVLEALRKHQLEPVVTLHHFTNPAWFLERGGWTRPDAPRQFARFVEHVARELGDGVQHWLTLNEPTVYARHAYLFGEWPPQAKNAWAKAARCMIHMARAHRLAYRALKERSPATQVGFAHSAAHLLPCNPQRWRDRLSTALRDRILNRWFLSSIRAPEHLDYLGLNYYNRTFVRSQGLGAHALFGQACHADHHDLGPRGQLGWEMHPAGLESVLQRFASLGVPLMVTENGIATDDEELRVQFLREHVSAVARAVAKGVEVRGYLYWSLMDNFEWALGTAPHFGLCAMDPATFARRPRPAALEFERIIRAARAEPRS